MKYKEIFYIGDYYLKGYLGKFNLKFRFDPIPHTGKCYSLGYLYRNIKTTQEKKYACDSEHKPYIRGRRSFSNLPDAWDEIPTSSIKRSWKRTKKRKQWM